jgi:hypothetical protein
MVKVFFKPLRGMRRQSLLCSQKIENRKFLHAGRKVKVKCVADFSKKGKVN